MGQKEIFGVRGVSPAFGIEVEPPGGESAHAQNFQHRLGSLVNIRGKLIRIPAVHRITPVRIHAPQQPRVPAHPKIVNEIMPRQSGMIGLDIALEIPVQTVVPQKSDHRRGVEIVLMLGGLHGFGFNVKLTREARLTSIIPGHAQESGDVIELPAHIRVPERHVSFPTAPEGVARPSEPDCRVKGRLHLMRRMPQHREIGTARGTVHVPGMGEQIGRAPEQPHAGTVLPLLRQLGEMNQILLEFRLIRPEGRHIRVVKGVERRTDLGEELECRVELLLRRPHGIIVPPGIHHGAHAEGVGTFVTERMPVGDGKAQVLLHGFPPRRRLGIVELESQRVVGLRTLVIDLSDSREEFLLADKNISHCCPPASILNSL